MPKHSLSKSDQDTSASCCPVSWQSQMLSHTLTSRTDLFCDCYPLSTLFWFFCWCSILVSDEGNWPHAVRRELQLADAIARIANCASLLCLSPLPICVAHQMSCEFVEIRLDAVHWCIVPDVIPLSRQLLSPSLCQVAILACATAWLVTNRLQRVTHASWPKSQCNHSCYHWYGFFSERSLFLYFLMISILDPR